MSKKKFDFSGWATKNDLECSDGRTIRRNAFKHCDGAVVPLVWQHMHNSPENVLGHALLTNNDEGVYAYCKFNDTDKAKTAKALVEHGDICSLSILANNLSQEGSNVTHGTIREVSLVLSGANPGARIDHPVLAHSGETIYDEAVIFNDEEQVYTEFEEPTIEHADNGDKDKDGEEPETKDTPAAKSDEEILDTLNEDQKRVVYGLIVEAMEADPDDFDDDDDDDDDADDEGDTENKEEKSMKHNVFDTDNQEQNNDVLMHDAMTTIIGDAKRCGSMKESFIQHSVEYGIENIEYLFPDARALNNAPEFIKRDMTWVQKFMNGTHHSPMSRIKSIYADITEDDARAKGYIKGNLKKEEFFSLIKRTTTPTTVYKKQKLDRDDIIDITDFDVVSWLKTEMRMMLDEEIARAALVGDGRLSSSDEHINETNIRPIWTDADLFTIKAEVSVASGDTDEDKAKKFIKTAIKARKRYKGSGTPTLYTTEDVLTDCLLIEDSTGRTIYDTVDKLATKLRVKEIVTVEVMENLTRSVEGVDHDLMGIIVNPADYNFGADKGGSVNMFDDFDIDYNQQKYLIETRCSGALTKPYSAIALEAVQV